MAISLPELVARVRLAYDNGNVNAKVAADLAKISALGNLASRNLNDAVPEFARAGAAAAENFTNELAVRIATGIGDTLVDSSAGSGIGKQIATSVVTGFVDGNVDKQIQSSVNVTVSNVGTSIKGSLTRLRGTVSNAFGNVFGGLDSVITPAFSSAGESGGGAFVEEINKSIDAGRDRAAEIGRNFAQSVDSGFTLESQARLASQFEKRVGAFQSSLRNLTSDNEVSKVLGNFNVTSTGREIGTQLTSGIERSFAEFSFGSIANDIGTRFKNSVRQSIVGVFRGSSTDETDAAQSGERIGSRAGSAFERAFGNSTDRTERRLSTFGRGIAFAGIIASVAALATQFIFLAAAVGPAAAAIAALPAVAGVALASISTLFTGFFGVFDAIKKTNVATSAGGGGGGTSASTERSKQRALESAFRDVADAEHGVAEATKEVEKAYRDVDGAQRDVVKSLRDVDSATKDVAAAQRGLEAAQRGVEAAQRSVADANDRVTEALRNIQSAQSSAVDSEKALTRAREDALATLDSYNLRLEESAADQESAAIAVLEAKQRLADLSKTEQEDTGFLINGKLFDKAGKEITDLSTKAVTSALDYRRARNDIEQAELHYQETLNRSADLQKEAQDAQKAGVDGADNVIAAQKQVEQATLQISGAQKQYRDALQGVSDANQGVVDAQQRVLDSNDAVADAQFRVQEAMQGVADAQQGLVDANDGVTEAQYRLVQANQAVVEANQRVSDAQADLADANAKVGAAATKAAAAMAALSPAARRFAEAILALKSSFNELKNSVQEALFANLDTEITSLANTSLPTLKTGMTAVATAINTVFINAAEAAKTPLFQGAVATIFATTAAATSTLATAIGPLTLGLANLAVAGLPLFTRFSNFVADLLTSAGAFLSSTEGAQKMTNAINEAGNVLSTLFGIAKNIGSILITIFQAAGVDGYLNALKNVTDEFARFLKTTKGQEDLKTLFTTLREVSEGILGALPTVAQALIDVLAAFNKLPDPIRNTIAQFLGFAIIIGPALSTLAGLSVSLSGIVSVFGTVSAAVEATAAALGIGVLPFVAIAAAVVGLGIAAVVAYEKFEGFRNAVNTAFESVLAVVGSVVAFLTAKFQEIESFSKEIWPSVEEAVRHTINVIVFLWSHFGGDILDVIRRAWDLVRSVISAALLVIQGVIELALGVINGDWSLAWKGLRDVVAGVWDAIYTIVVNGIKLVFNALEIVSDLGAAILDGLMAGLEKAGAAFVGEFVKLFENIILFPFKVLFRIASPSGVFEDFGGFLLQGLLNGMVQGYGGVALFFLSLPIKFAEYFLKAPLWLFPGGQAALKGALDGIRSVFDSTSLDGITGFFGALPGRLQNFTKDAALWLPEHGKDAIRGFINGNRDLANSATEGLNAVGSFIRQKTIEAVKDPKSFLLEAGKDIIRGLINGINALTTDLGNTLSGVVQGGLKKAKDAIGIKSPSTVFRDEVGKNIGLGIAAGISASGPDVAGALTDLVGTRGNSADIGALVNAASRFPGGAAPGGNTYQVVNQGIAYTPQQLMNESFSALRQLERVYGA